MPTKSLLNIIPLQVESLFGPCLSGDTHGKQIKTEQTLGRGIWICVDGRVSGARYPSDNNGGISHARKNSHKVRLETKPLPKPLQSRTGPMTFFYSPFSRHGDSIKSRDNYLKSQLLQGKAGIIIFTRQRKTQLV